MRPAAWHGVLGRAVAANTILLFAGLIYTVALMTEWDNAGARSLLFSLLLAIFSTAPLLLTGLDQMALRFARGTSSSSDARLLIGLLLVKLVCAALVIATCTTVWAFARHPAGPSGESVAFVTAIAFHAGLAPAANAWATRVLLIHGAQLGQLRVELAHLLACTSWVLVCGRTVASLEALAVGLALISATALITRMIVIARVAPRLWRRLRTQAHHPIFAVRTAMSRSRLRYLWPMSVSAGSGFIKDAFPVIALGVGGTAGVAEFRVLQLLFRSAAGVLPEAMEWTRPSMQRELRRNAPSFEAGYRQWARTYIAGFTAMGMALVAGAAFMLPAFGLEASDTLYWCAALLAVDLVLTSALQLDYQLYVLRGRHSRARDLVDPSANPDLRGHRRTGSALRQRWQCGRIGGRHMECMAGIYRDRLGPAAAPASACPRVGGVVRPGFDRAHCQRVVHTKALLNACASPPLQPRSLAR